MEINKPMHSPWGKIQSCDQVKEGVYAVSTPGHGGILVHKSLFQNLSDYAREQAIPCDHSEYFGFEEDCDWALPAFELNLFADKEKAKLDTLCFWHTDYVSTHISKELLSSEQLEMLAGRISEEAQELEREKLKKIKSPTLTVAASNLTRSSDYERVFVLGPIESPEMLLKILAARGEIFNPDAIASSLEGVGTLVAVWTADDKLHIVDGYPQQRNIITELQECGNLIFSSK